MLGNFQCGLCQIRFDKKHNTVGGISIREILNIVRIISGFSDTRARKNRIMKCKKYNRK